VGSDFILGRFSLTFSPTLIFAVTITVATWNILSENYIRYSYYPTCPKHALEWKHRKAAFQRVAGQLDVDVLCLQEMDKFSAFWEPEMLNRTCCQESRFALTPFLSSLLQLDMEQEHI
jgi:mRNA deadenylase 3'-5' endonuclease subunit Ccr4